MDERDLLAALARAISDGAVSVELDCNRLMHTDSPIAVQAEHTRWLYGIVAVTLAVGFGWDWTRGLAALILGIVFYAGIGRPWLHRRMRARFFTSTIFDTGQFKRLWRLKGVTLRLAGAAAALSAGPAGGGEDSCDSPQGDWRRFVLDRVMGDGKALDPGRGSP
ncbi:MAG: hypothetical protein RL477_1870 [Pseudomonadota bacterium]|jgi:hypothetical protein